MGSFLHTSYEALGKFKPHPPHDVSYANLPRNNPKNRRGAPLPPGHSRVKLQLVLEEVGSDYINARSAIKHTSPIATSPWSHSCTPNSRGCVWIHILLVWWPVQVVQVHVCLSVCVCGLCNIILCDNIYMYNTQYFLYIQARLQLARVECGWREKERGGWRGSASALGYNAYVTYVIRYIYIV